MDSVGDEATALHTESDVECMIQHVLSSLQEGEELQQTIVARLHNILQPVKEDVFLSMKKLCHFRQHYPLIIQNFQRSSEIFKQILKWLDEQMEENGASSHMKEEHKQLFPETANQCSETSLFLTENNRYSYVKESTISDNCETWDDTVIICKSILPKLPRESWPQSCVKNNTVTYGKRSPAASSPSSERMCNQQNGSLDLPSFSGMMPGKGNAVQQTSSRWCTSEMLKQQNIENSHESNVTRECSVNDVAKMEKLDLGKPDVQRSLLDNTQYRVEIQTLFVRDKLEMEVTVSYFVNPSFFYIQPCGSQLHQMMEAFNWEIQQNEHLGGDIYPCVGMYILAKYSEDDYWYRARIMNVTDIQNTSVLDVHPLNLKQLVVHVLFVDYGNRDCLPVSRIRHLRPEFCQLPQQSICASLAYVSPVDEVMWTTSQIKWFAAKVTNKTFYAVFHHIQGRTSVELYTMPKVNGKYTYGTSLSDMMLCDGMASRHGMHGCSGLPQCDAIGTKINRSFITHLNVLKQSKRTLMIEKSCHAIPQKDEGQVSQTRFFQNFLKVERKANELSIVDKDNGRDNHYTPASETVDATIANRLYIFEKSELLTENEPSSCADVTNGNIGHAGEDEQESTDHNADFANYYTFPEFNRNVNFVESAMPAAVGVESDSTSKYSCSPCDSHFERVVDDKHVLAQEFKHDRKEYSLPSSKSIVQVQQSSRKVLTVEIHDRCKDNKFPGRQHGAESATNTVECTAQFQEPSTAAGGCGTGVFPAMELVSPSQEYFFCTVISIVSPGEFYVHVKSEWATDMERMCQDLERLYNSTENLELGGKTEDLIGKSCCLRICPGQRWFRGLVTMVSPHSQYAPEQVQVLLVDLGQADWFPRFEVKKLKPEFEKYPAFAQRCSLFNIQPTEQSHGRKWTQDALYKFGQVTDYNKTFMGKICNRSVSEGLDIVLLETSNDRIVNVNELMVHWGYATYNEMPRTTENLSHSLKTLSCNLQKHCTYKSLQNLGIVRSKGEKLAKKPYEVIQKAPDKIGVVMKHGKSRSSNALHCVSECSTGSSSDARITQAVAQHMGDTDDCVALNSWDPRAQDFLSRRNNYAVSPDDLSVAMTGRAAPSHKRCQLWQRGRCTYGDRCRFLHCFPDNIMEDMQKVYCKPFNVQLPHQGSVVSLFITSIQNLCHFWACLTPEKVSHGTKMVTNEYSKGVVDAVVSQHYDLETYQEMMVDLQEYYSKYSFHEASVTLPALGELVVVLLNSDNKFYRARMCELHSLPFEVKVFLVDMGRMECVLLSQIHTMKPEFLHMPFQALECSLHGVTVTEAGMSKLASASFKELVFERRLVARVESVSPLHIVYVTAYIKRDGCKQELNCWLVQQGWCQTIPSTRRQVPAETPSTFRTTLEYLMVPG